MAEVLVRGPEVAREPVCLWPAEGFPNVKGCGPRKRATEVIFQNWRNWKKIEHWKERGPKNKKNIFLICEKISLHLGLYCLVTPICCLATFLARARGSCSLFGGRATVGHSSSSLSQRKSHRNCFRFSNTKNKKYIFLICEKISLHLGLYCLVTPICCLAQGWPTCWTAGHFKKIGRRRGPHHIIWFFSFF